MKKMQFNKKIQILKRVSRTNILIVFMAVFLFSILLIIVGRRVGTDDIFFKTQIQPYHSILSWCQYRYNSWSGRVFADASVYVFTQAHLVYWKVVSLIFYGLFVTSIYSYYLLFTTRREILKDRIILIFVLSLPFFTGSIVLFDGIFWVTGAMNYFWIATIALISFYPVVYYSIKHESPHWLITIICLLSAIISANSQEQAGLILSILATLFMGYNLYIWFKKETKTFPIYTLIFCLTFWLALIVNLLAPGNIVRNQAETLKWLPDLYTVPLLQRVVYSTRWLFDSIINRSGILLIGSWVLQLYLYIKKSNKDRIDTVFTILLSVMCLLYILKGFDGVSYWFSFFPTWRPQVPYPGSYLIILPWAISFIITIVSPVVLYRKRIAGLLVSGLYVTFFLSIAAVTLSPTMYASGPRTMFMPSILIMIIVLILFDEFMNVYKNNIYLVLVPVLCLAGSQYLLQIIKLLSVR